MEHKRKIGSIPLLLLFLAVATASTQAQEEASGITEAIAGIMSLTDEYEVSFLMERLSEIEERPAAINSGDEEEIARLFFLTEFQVRVLADYVTRKGDIVSLYELALLPAFDRATVMLMAPYITLEPSDRKNSLPSGSTTVVMTATTRIATEDNITRGVRSLAKVRHEGPRLSYGVTAENDPGEPFTFDGAAGPDFLSGNLIYRGRGIIDRIIIGDYSLRFGEGLVFNSGSWQGSWLSSPSFMTGRSALTQYTSTEENNFFRGVGCVLGSITRGIVVFASSNFIDARLLFDSDSNAVAVTNLVKGGIHDSPSAREARNSLTETMTGLHLTWGTEKIRAGMTSSVTWFSLPFQPDTMKPENITAFSGSRLLNLAVDIKAGTGPLLFFIESGVSFPGSWAVIGGIRARPSDRVTFNILGRHFSPDYHSFHSGAYSASSSASNETGLAASLHFEAARHLFVSAGADHYRVPWPRYRSSSPAYGNRTEIKCEYLPREDLSLRLTYTSAAREYDLENKSGISFSETRMRRLLAFTFLCSPAENLSLTTRVSASHIMPSGEKGFLLCQDISYALCGVPLRLWFRYALCSSGGYDSRLYAWENDLLHSFSVPAMYGECSRTFVMLSWKPSEKMELRAKYAITASKAEFVREIKQEVRVQCRLLF
ncbi:MAG TPA: hypothetical protein VFB86_03155 [Bacteroidales bacterium]|nr:hypothetical protein [Bacteroidales bacterium]